ncbi:hypothetical protein KUTeg_002052 [Tegillarca granosa]|uniref:Uncharacterized protein n=1 Tax=Tegillarca granosa TaxID=220873 RepID=A0ABQ9FTA7_TEGGR|nr:hypothetical protein KUTeg_002052 [Tegillarca granosa]
MVTVHNERKMMKQTMAQTHVEPLDEFRGFRIQEIEPDKERENSVNVRIATYNSAEVDSLVNLLENGQLEKEFENYVKATVFGVSHIGFAIEVKPSEIEHWRNVFITRTKKPLPSQRPPLKPKPTEEQPSKKTANVYAVIQKLFCVFVPSDQVTNIRTVKIKTLQGPSSITEKINNKELVEHSQIKRLWTLRVTLPANMSLNFNYKYCVTGVQSNLSSSLRSSFDFSETEDIVPENLSRTCLDFRTERDVFGNSEHLEDGVLGHFKHILCDADDTDINDSFYEINSLKEVEKLSIDRKEKIIKESTNDRCQDLFQQLIELPGFCEENSQSSKAFVVGWYEIVPSSEKLDALWKSCKFNYEENLKMLEDTVKNVKEIERLKEYAGDSFSETCSIVGLYIEEKIDELSTEGQQRYKDVWEPFVEGNDVEVDEVLKCFRSAVGRNEVKLAETQLSRKLNEDMKSALMNLLNYKEYKNKIFIIKSALDTFEIDQYHSSEFMKYFDIILKMSKLSLLTVSPVLKYLYAIADDVDDSMKEVLSVLRKTEKSIELIHFLRREIDVDMGNLVDSVEDYSDQNLSTNQKEYNK